jgi:hypothetical protein
VFVVLAVVQEVVRVRVLPPLLVLVLVLVLVLPPALVRLSLAFGFLQRQQLALVCLHE